VSALFRRPLPRYLLSPNALITHFLSRQTSCQSFRNTTCCGHCRSLSSPSRCAVQDNCFSWPWTLRLRIGSTMICNDQYFNANWSDSLLKLHMDNFYIE